MAKFSLTVSNFAGRLTVDDDGSMKAEASSGYVVRVIEGFTSITCLVCGTTSYNPHDVEHKYCARCATFHEDR